MNRITLRIAAIGLLADVALSETNTAFADSTPFSRIVIFGDSLSDTGNFHRRSEVIPTALIHSLNGLVRASERP